MLNQTCSVSVEGQHLKEVYGAAWVLGDRGSNHPVLVSAQSIEHRAGESFQWNRGGNECGAGGFRIVRA